MLFSLSPIAVIKGFLEFEEQAGDFIANGPSTGIAGHARDAYRKRCDQFANAPLWARLLLDGSKGALGRVCQPWYDAQDRDGPVVAPPFTGGQCEVRYDVFGTFVSNQTNVGGCGSTGNWFVSGLPGPIGGIGTTEGTQGTFYVQGNGFRFNCTQVGGTRQLIDVAVCGESLGAQTIRSDKPTITNVVRQDGLPDNCGNLPEDLTPGPNPPDDPGPTPGPEPTVDPRNPTGVPYLPIPPYEDPIGGPTPIEAPDVEPPTIDPGDRPGDFDTQPGGPENVGEPIGVDPGGGGGGGGTDFGAPPPGRAWVGCLLRFTFPAGAGAIAGSGPTNTVSPRTFGNASLIFAGGLGTAWRVNSASMSLIRESAALQVTGVFVNVLPGFTYTIRPISVEIEPTSE